MHYQAATSWGSYVTPRKSGGGRSIRTHRELASENAVVIFSVSTCCMCHAIKRLFCGMGVNPTVHELDGTPEARTGTCLMRLLVLPSGVLSVMAASCRTWQSMACHINATIVHRLKEQLVL
ncbi:glutaredoxin-C5-like [Vigna umbellata]|uniref:glutaredoxin-C5-like n=1 Tax=Vigna umbellata TaxID=87088 RepID=UPI001F5EADF3|nr:glutaredoxin-C5-like [Vigna umbellata]